MSIAANIYVRQATTAQMVEFMKTFPVNLVPVKIRYYAMDFAINENTKFPESWVIDLISSSLTYRFEQRYENILQCGLYGARDTITESVQLLCECFLESNMFVAGFLGSRKEYECKHSLVLSHETLKTDKERLKVLGLYHKNTTYLGKNINKYIPGLYWKNYFSKRFLEETGFLDFQSISNLKVDETERGVKIQTCDKMNEWKKASGKVESLYSTNRIFDIRVAKETIERKLDDCFLGKDARKLLDEWR